MGISFDPMLYATEDCTFPGECLAGTIINKPGEPEEIDFDVAAGETASWWMPSS